MWLVLTTGTEGNLIQWEVRRPYSTPRIFQPLSGGAHNMKRKRDKVTKINTSAKKIRQRVLYSACWQGARLQARTANRCSSCKYKWTVGSKRKSIESTFFFDSPFWFCLCICVFCAAAALLRMVAKRERIRPLYSHGLHILGGGRR